MLQFAARLRNYLKPLHCPVAGKTRSGGGRQGELGKVGESQKRVNKARDRCLIILSHP